MTEPRRASGFFSGGEPPPLRTHLRDDLDEGQVKSMWERIDHTPARARRPWLLLSATAAALLLLALGALRHWREPEARQLALLSGKPPSVLSAAEAPTASRFDDGSQVSLTGGARLEVLRNDARSFVTALRRGGATFDVKPGGPRHWIVEAGELSVEVVGTRFRVERQGEATRVSVHHGVVLVRGERVPGGSVRLTAGTSFELPAGSAARAGELPAPPAPAATPPAAVPSVPMPLGGPSSTGPATATPAGSAAGEPATGDAVDRALGAADLARRHGDVAEAVRSFELAWQQAAPGDVRRGLAALSLARLLMTGQPAQAARILRSSLSDMPQALLEDASVRLVEAESRAGNHEAAQRAGQDYARRFPAGRRADEVRRWSNP
jgi:transmembrane sensor